MTTHEEVDVERGTAAVTAILHPNGAELPVPGNLNRGLTAPIIPTGRKKRADAGKPRETFYVSIPGVRFDVGSVDGRTAFERWLSGSLTGQSADIVDAIRQVLREIDRLRMK